MAGPAANRLRDALRGYGLIDRSNWKYLITLALGWTLLLACVYAWLTVQNTGNGLTIESYPEPKPVPWLIAFGNAVYFSIATETTLGYGDLVPHGLSRYLACIQAAGGLMLAGLFVSKITTGPFGKTKAIIEQIEGNWIEYCLAEECTIISLITIEYTDGLLRYDGHNYDCDGEPRRGFEGTSQPLGTIDGQTIWFDYDNRRGDNAVFNYGKTYLTFQRLDRDTGKYTYCEGAAQDSNRSEEIPMFAYRAPDSQAEAFKSWKADETDVQRSVIAQQAYKDRFHEIEIFRRQKLAKPELVL